MVKRSLLSAMTAAVLAVHGAAPATTAGQSLSRDELAAIHRLRCVFPVAAIGGWDNGEPRARLNTEGVLSLQIESIDAQDGSARILGTSAEAAHVVAQLAGWSLHFLETDATGGVNMTTVFAQHSRSGKLKAMHARASFVPVEVPGFRSEPAVSQYYGECEIVR